MNPSSIGSTLSIISPGVLGNWCKITVIKKPVKIESPAAMLETFQFKTFENTIGTKVAPNAVQAKMTRSKIVSGAKRERMVATTTTKHMAILALLMFVPLPPFQSRSTDEATVKSWLSAVDMIAERTAAVIIPENTGPKSL